MHNIVQSEVSQSIAPLPEQAPLLGEIEPAQLLVLQAAVECVPRSLRKAYPDNVVESVRVKLSTAAGAAIVLSMHDTAREGVLHPSMVLAPDLSSANDMPSVVEAESDQKSRADAGEKTVVRFVPLFEEDETAIAQEDVRLATAALRAERQRRERDAARNRAEAAVKEQEAQLTDEDRSAIKQAVLTEKADSIEHAVAELQEAKGIALNLGRRERAFLRAAVRRYDLKKRWGKLSKDLLHPPEPNDISPVSISIDESIEGVLGTDSVRGRMAVALGYTAAWLEVHSKSGERLVRGLRTAVLLKDLLLK